MNRSFVRLLPIVLVLLVQPGRTADAQTPDSSAAVLDTLSANPKTNHFDLLIGPGETPDRIRRLLSAIARESESDKGLLMVDCFMTTDAFLLHSGTHPEQSQLRRDQVDPILAAGFAASLIRLPDQRPTPRIIWQQRFRELGQEIVQ